MTQIAQAPPILYKYLGPAGAREFLNLPHTKFIDLDDILDTMPGFTPMADDQARLNALERVTNNPLDGISLEHQRIILEEYGKIPTSYFEESMREILSEQGDFPYRMFSFCGTGFSGNVVAICWTPYGDCVRH